MTAGISEGDEGPTVAVVVHLHHLRHVRLLEAASSDALAADALRQQVEERPQHGGLDAVEVATARQLDGEDEIQIVIGLRLRGEHVRGGAAVEADVPHADARLRLQLGAHNSHQVAQTHLQRGEIAATVDRHHLVHHVVQATHLLVAQHGQALLAVRVARVVPAAANLVQRFHHGHAAPTLLA